MCFRELRGANEKAEQLQRQFAEVDQQDVKHRADVKNAREGIPKLNKETETLGKKVKACCCYCLFFIMRYDDRVLLNQFVYILCT